MDHPPQNQHGNIPHPSADFGSVPNNSESFGSVRNATEEFRSVPHNSERKDSHTLTVREVARMFEAASVARTERSIVNWCQPNRTGIARLDSYFDPNERRYYISPQSVEQAIAEEKAKAAKINESSEPIGKVSQDSESEIKIKPSSGTENPKISELEREIKNLRIANEVKDLFIDRLKNTQTDFVERLLEATHKVGVLETTLLQIESPERSLIGGSQGGVGSEK